RLGGLKLFLLLVQEFNNGYLISRSDGKYLGFMFQIYESNGVPRNIEREDVQPFIESTNSTSRACVFIDSSNPNLPNQVMNMFTKPFIKLAFPPVINIRDLMTKQPDSRASVRGPNAFIIYRKIFVETARADGYQLPMTVVSSMASQSWEQESEIVKAEYKRLAKEANEIRNEISPKSPRRPKRERWNIVSFQKQHPSKDKTSLRKSSSKRVKIPNGSSSVESISSQQAVFPWETTHDNNNNVEASTEFQPNNLSNYDSATIGQLYDLFVEGSGNAADYELSLLNFDSEANSVEKSLNNSMIPRDMKKLEEPEFSTYSNESSKGIEGCDSTDAYFNIIGDLSCETTWTKLLDESLISENSIALNNPFFGELLGASEMEYQNYALSSLSSPEIGNSCCSDLGTSEMEHQSYASSSLSSPEIGNSSCSDLVSDIIEFSDSEESTISSDLKSMTQFPDDLGVSSETNYNGSFYF
ncbi:10448_t:CDS:2, partial [Acaulospora morrowiae]